MLHDALRTALLVAAIASCGGKAIIDPEPTAEGTTSESSTTSGGVDPVVGCGAAGACVFACCLDLAEQNSSPFCATDCESASSFLCDGPEDCDGGRCCGDIDGTACQPSCDVDQLERCQTDLDCTVGACALAVVGTVSIGFCDG